MKNFLVFFLFIFTYCLAQDIDLSNYQKYATNHSITFLGREQIHSSDYSILDYYRINYMFSLNQYEIGEDGEYREPSYYRIVISADEYDIDFESFFLQFQGNHVKGKGNKHFNISTHLYIDGFNRNYALGGGVYYSANRNISNNKKLFYDVAVNIFPLTFDTEDNSVEIFQTATIIPQFAFVYNKLQITFELFNYITYHEREIVYKFRPALLVGFNGYTFW